MSIPPGVRPTVQLALLRRDGHILMRLLAHVAARASRGAPMQTMTIIDTLQMLQRRIQGSEVWETLMHLGDEEGALMAAADAARRWAEFTWHVMMHYDLFAQLVNSADELDTQVVRMVGNYSRLTFDRAADAEQLETAHVMLADYIAHPAGVNDIAEDTVTAWYTAPRLQWDDDHPFAEPRPHVGGVQEVLDERLTREEGRRLNEMTANMAPDDAGAIIDALYFDVLTDAERIDVVTMHPLQRAQRGIPAPV